MKFKVIFGILLTYVFCSMQLSHCEEKKDPKILVLIICSDNLPVYKGLQESWRSYMHLDPEHFESYFIRSDPELSSEFLVKDDAIWSRTQECVIPGVLNKTLLTLEAMLPRLNEFDYVLRTNLSSFYVFPTLLNFLKDAPREKFYCGVHHDWDSRHPAGWVCGAGILMSVDLAKLLLSYKDSLLDLPDLSPQDWSNIDDVVIGDVFAKNGIPIVRGLNSEIYTAQDWNNVQADIPEHIFHFRIKTPEANRLVVDLAIHSVLLNHFYNKNISLIDFCSTP